VWLERYLGEAKVREALRTYLQAHAHGVAATADFVTALGDPALGAALEARLDAPLMFEPRVTTALRCADTAELVLTLQHPSVVAAMPACVIYEQRGARVETCVHVAPSATIALPACPAWAVASERTPYVDLMIPPARFGW
jgi:hypothetical protein